MSNIIQAVKILRIHTEFLLEPLHGFCVDPTILILDEATVALDPLTEAQITAAIDTFAADRTVITIAHRLQTLRHADLIVGMREGRVCELGTHEELLAQNGTYRELYLAKL